MKLSERLRIFATRIKLYFVSDQVRNFVLFLEDFFPSEKIFGVFGFTFFNGLQNTTNQQRQKQLFWIILAITLLSTILAVINFVHIFGDHEKFVEAIETFCWISGYIQILLLIYFLYYRKREPIMKIIERLEQNFTQSNHEQLQFGVIKHHRKLKLIFKFYLFVFFWAWLHLNYMPLLQFLYDHEVKLLHPLWFPLYPLQPLLYPIFFFIQSCSICFAVTVQVAMDTLFCSIICVISLEFDVLAQKLSKIDPENDENAEKKLQKIIDGYNKLTDIANELEKIISLLSFVHIFAGIFMLCTCVFLLFSPISFYLMLKFTIGLPALLFQIFTLCFYGEQLQNSSMRVADGAYNCNWYGKNLKFRKMILLTMLRTQKPQKLTGMKFMDVGMPVYYWSLQTAHSYYSVLSGFYAP
ncbi:hypothetical protein PVAND_003157 [Polypedilum vanderplanki]|uniref:Odorant receptor n=1 Tax=Polypedilum vanderplanki TaxID=319348 RepID=A0A9J6BTM1_POLVA|nr:hypothetical protein PVAND_003157 [Polypedilum vanderplanki]